MLEASKIEELVEDLARPLVEHEGYELLEVAYVQSRGWKLRLVIDREGGVSVEDCARVSRIVEQKLDQEGTVPIGRRYTLEVSSPGLDRKLYNRADYERFAGRKVKVKLLEPVAGRRNYKGILNGYKDGKIVLSLAGKETDMAFEPDQVKEVRLDPDFKVPY